MRLAVAGAALALVVTGSPGEARDLVFGSWLGANNTTNSVTLQRHFDDVAAATNGEIEWQLIPGGQLASGPGTPEAVKNGLMDGGVTMAPYVPSILPATNLIFSQSLIGDDFLASIGAMNEALMLGCDECHEEFREQNAVGYGGYGVTPYLFLCRGDVATKADLQGKKIRGSGGGVSIIEITGGVPVSMPPNDATTALERGALDCVLGNVQWLESFGYMDVVDTVIQAPMGMGGPPVLMYLNRDMWESLTPEQRKAHIDNAAAAVTYEAFDAQLAGDAEVMEKARENGVTFVEGGDEFYEIMEERDSIQYQLNVDNAKAAGVENPEAILDFYLAAYEKWKKLIDEEIGEDRDKFQEAVQREVYDKVDPESL
jgi:TRAP-type C4-dicarboxylate transport system substrate-binding protein